MIEVTVKDYLEEKLTVPCYMEVPEDPDESYVVIEKTGSSKHNRILKATFAIQSYARTLYEAALLNEEVKEAMDRIIDLDEISKVELNSDYNYTNTAMKANRYQAVFVVTHY